MGKVTRSKQESKLDKTPEPSGLRRSTRGTSLKEGTTPSPLSTRKPEGSGKKSPATAAVRKSGRLERHDNPSPLRRSSRGKAPSSPDASGAKNSNKLSGRNMKRTMEKKDKNEKAVKHLVLETEDIGESKKLDEETVTFNKARLPARHYFKLFKDREKRVNMTDHASAVGSIQNPTSTSPAWNGSIRDCDAGEELEHVLSKRKRDTADAVPHAPPVVGSIQNPPTTSSALNGSTRDCDIGEELEHVVSKRKRDTADAVSLAPLVVGSEERCTNNAEAVASSSSQCKNKDCDEACNSCFKKQRVEFDTPAKENCCEAEPNNLVNSDAKDRGEIKAGGSAQLAEEPNHDLQQNEPSENLQSNSPNDLECSDSPQINSSDNNGNLKESFTNHTAKESKSESSRFIEYWVPVQMSNVQLEKYCAILLENFFTLSSPSKRDHVDALLNTLTSIRKCCDHPYLVDKSLPDLLGKGHEAIEYLDIGIKASGKLQLLEAMLLETKNRGLRALILFQSIGGSEKVVIGDILDDFLRQRFGDDSFERVDSGLVYSKKQSFVNKFNKESGRFVFLLETRACSPIIKLSAVDVVIMFNSDWNPMSDIKALQRISLDSKSEQVMIFRLYSSFTVEEKALILAKQDMVLDGSKPNINPSTRQTLLMWGASYLFNKLNEFHDGSAPALESTLVDDALQEFSVILTRDRECFDQSKLSIIVHAKPQTTYRTDFPLFGEQKIQVVNEDPPTFWTKLLKGSFPRWKYSSSFSQRNKKRASTSHLDYSEKGFESEGGKSVKKQKNVANSPVESPSLRPGLLEQMDGQVKEGLPVTSGAKSDNQNKLLDSQQSLRSLLKPDIAKLAEVLHLPDNVRVMAESFLEYITNNNHLVVEKDSVTILQSFLISLCWTSAGILKHKINRKDSLAIAKQHLNFECPKQEAEYIYSILQCLKRVFLYRTGQWQPPKTSDLSSENDYQLAQLDLNKSIKEIQRKCDKKLKNEIQRQWEEKQGIKRMYEEEKQKLGEKKRTEEAVVRLVRNPTTRSGNLKKLNDEYEMSVADLYKKMDVHLANLETLHLEARNRILQSKETWVEMVRSWAHREFGLDDFNKSISSGHDQEQVSIGGMPDGGVGREVRLDGESSGRCIPKEEILDTDMLPSSTEQVHEGTLNNADTDMLPSSTEQIHEGTLSHADTDVGASQAICETEGHKISVSAPSHASDDQNPVEATLTVAHGEASTNADEAVGFSNNQQNVLPLDLSSSREQIPYASGSSIAEEVLLAEPETVADDIVEGNDLSVRHPMNILDGEVPVTAPEVVNSSDADNVVGTNPSSVEEEIPRKGSLPDKEAEASTPQVSLSGSHLIPEEVQSCDKSHGDNDGAIENISTTDLLSLPDGEVGATTSEVVITCCDHGFETVYSANPPTDEENLEAAPPCMPEREVPLSDPVSAPSEVLEGRDANKETDGAVLASVENLQTLSEPVSAPSEVLERRDANKETDGAVLASVENLQTLSEPLSAPSEALEGRDANKETDGAVLASVENLQTLSEPVSAPSEVLESRDANEETDGAVLASVENLQTENSFGPPREEENSEVASASGQEVPLTGFESAPSEVREADRLIQPSTPVIVSDHSNIPNGDSVCSPPSEDRAVGAQLLDSMVVCTVNQEAPVPVSEVPTSDSVHPRHISTTAQVEPSRTTIQPKDVPSTGRLEIPQPPRHVTDARTVPRNHHPVQNVPTGSCNDPLKKEMERLKREKDETFKIHEETKLKLKADFDKEVEEAMAQIRKRHEVKVMETETVFQFKVKELDSNLNKVIMSKFLADAFRKKMIDDNPNAPTPAIGSNSVPQPPVQLSSGQMAPRPSQTGSRPATTTQVRPLMQIPPAIFSPPPRQPGPPPLISTISPPAPRIPQTSAEIRATPPHLRPYRPPSSTPPIISIQTGLGNPAPPRPAPPASTQPSRPAHLSPTSGGLPVFTNPSARNFQNGASKNPVPPNTAAPFQPVFTLPATRPFAPQTSAAPNPNLPQTGLVADVADVVVDLSDDDEDHLKYLNL